MDKLLFWRKEINAEFLNMNALKKISFFTAAFAAASCAFAQSETLKLWKGTPPGEVCAGVEELKQVGDIKKFLNVSSPEIQLFPAAGDAPAPAVIICPGGAYKIMAWDLEGTEIAQWLNSIGFTAVILKYRVPDNRDGAFMDAQRAVRLVRANAEKWKIDPQRVGILGFSAGAHLSARTSASFKDEAYAPIDEADKLSPRPDFTVLVYPAYLSADENYALSPEIKADKETPPAFIIEAQDDKLIDSAVAYYLALKKLGIKADIHLYAQGGHGIGIRNKADGKPIRAWNDVCGEWLKYYFGAKKN